MMNPNLICCFRCGSMLSPDTDDPHVYTCRYCGRKHDASLFQSDVIVENPVEHERIRKMPTLRRALYNAATMPTIDRQETRRAAEALLAIDPQDFFAAIAQAALSGNTCALNRAILSIDAEAHAEDIGYAVEFLLRTMTVNHDCLLALTHLVRRTYRGTDLSSYSRLMNQVANYAEEAFDGVFESRLPRDIYVSCSEEDMPLVVETVTMLEDQGFTCFVPLRNMRHDGVMEDFDAVIREAMENCRVFLFVSSVNSRNIRCDALRLEMIDVQNRDTAVAPSEYRHDYARIPACYKKPRIEYRIEESSRLNVADHIVERFFDGCKPVYTPDDLLEGVAKLLLGSFGDEHSGSDTPPPLMGVPCEPLRPPRRSDGNP